MNWNTPDQSLGDSPDYAARGAVKRSLFIGKRIDGPISKNDRLIFPRLYLFRFPRWAGNERMFSSNSVLIKSGI
jgi:hypothetical protein